MAIPTHREVTGWPRMIKYEPGLIEFERKLECAWDDRGELIKRLTTYPDNVYPYDVSGATTIFVADEPFPKSKGVGWPSNGSLMDYEKALLTVRYRASSTSPKYKQGVAYLFTERLTPFMEVERHHPENLYWEDGKALSHYPEKIHFGFEYRLTYFYVFSMPAAWKNYIGYINNGTFVPKLLSGATAETGTMLYRGPSVSHSVTTEGETAMTVELAFVYQARRNSAGTALGWNAEWRPDKGEYQYVWTNDLESDHMIRYPSGSFAF